MPTINDTVRSALEARGQSSYLSYATPVVNALTEREREISDQLLSYAHDLGADTSDVRNKLTELGMAVTQPEPELDDDEDEDEDEDDEDDDPDTTADSAAIARIEAAVSAMSNQVTSLTEFARRNGYRG